MCGKCWKLACMGRMRETTWCTWSRLTLVCIYAAITRFYRGELIFRRCCVLEDIITKFWRRKVIYLIFIKNSNNIINIFTETFFLRNVGHFPNSFMARDFTYVTKFGLFHKFYYSVTFCLCSDLNLLFASAVRLNIIINISTRIIVSTVDRQHNQYSNHRFTDRPTTDL